MPASEATARPKKRRNAKTTTPAPMPTAANAPAAQPERAPEPLACFDLCDGAARWRVRASADGRTGTEATAAPATIAWPEPDGWAVGDAPHAKRMAAAADTTSDAIALWLCESPAAWARAHAVYPQGTERLARGPATLGIGLLLASLVQSDQPETAQATGSTPLLEAQAAPNVVLAPGCASPDARRALEQACALACIGAPQLLARDWLVAQAIHARGDLHAAPAASANVQPAEPEAGTSVQPTANEGSKGDADVDETSVAHAATHWLQLHLGEHRCEATLVSGADPARARIVARASSDAAALMELTHCAVGDVKAPWQQEHGGCALDAVACRRLAEAAAHAALNAALKGQPQTLDLPAIALAQVSPQEADEQGDEAPPAPRVIGLHATLEPKAAQRALQSVVAQSMALVQSVLASADQAPSAIAAVVVEACSTPQGEAVAAAAGQAMQQGPFHWPLWEAPTLAQRMAAASASLGSEHARRSFVPAPPSPSQAHAAFMQEHAPTSPWLRTLSLNASDFADLHEAVQQERAAAAVQPADVEGETDAEHLVVADADESQPMPEAASHAEHAALAAGDVVDGAATA